MARIRSVHPSLWTDDAFLGLSMPAKLFVIALWNECDDGGGFEWKPRQLKVRLFGCDDMDVPAMLGELEQTNFVRRYEADGAPYGAVRSFGKFQKPQKPTRTYPMPQAMRAYAKTEKVGRGGEDDEVVTDRAPEGDSNEGAPTAVAPCSGADTLPLSDDYNSGSVAVASGEERRGEDSRGREELPWVVAHDTRDARGSRLPEDWAPDLAGQRFAVELKLDPHRVLPGFIDYWRAKAGKDGRKADWAATWRSWCRREAERPPTPGRAGSGRRQDPAMSEDWSRLDHALGIEPAGAFS